MEGLELVKEMACHHRRPLSNINQNIMDKEKPCVVNRVDLSRYMFMLKFNLSFTFSYISVCLFCKYWNIFMKVQD